MLKESIALGLYEVMSRNTKVGLGAAGAAGAAALAAPEVAAQGYKSYGKLVGKMAKNASVPKSIELQKRGEELAAASPVRKLFSAGKKAFTKAEEAK